MHRIKLIIEYDGSNYHGFQRQKNAPTIQAEIEKGILKLIGTEQPIISAGRTDTGVHALGQVVIFDTKSSIPPEKWPFALNSVLPSDIRVLASLLVPSTFHPRYDAVSKLYKYRIYRHKVGRTFVRNYALSYSKPLDMLAMQAACDYIKGEHDFKSFCASGSSVKSYVRNVMDCYFIEEDDYIDYFIEANGFLYNMIRIIMGVLLEVGQNQMPPARVKEIILAKDRRLASATAPPQGLYLVEVKY
ncbi:MAG TPA: tRNA pseudouridine(38-40) synthase TruA [Syntrophomonadaceae bacterium]|nr:tRNA pseudouridine(38-40) synthase TruA [Syntrophomonadaceae bacterium]